MKTTSKYVKIIDKNAYKKKDKKVENIEKEIEKIKEKVNASTTENSDSVIEKKSEEKKSIKENKENSDKIKEKTHKTDIEINKKDTLKDSLQQIETLSTDELNNLKNTTYKDNSEIKSIISTQIYKNKQYDKLDDTIKNELIKKECMCLLHCLSYSQMNKIANEDNGMEKLRELYNEYKYDYEN